jgi:hypothetical protein
LSSVPIPTTTPDLALVRALIGWGPPAVARAWDSLDPAWRGRLEALLPAVEPEPAAARAALAREHAAASRIDPAHVHPSWWVRALQDESPAVRRVVAAHVPAAIAEALGRDLHPDADALRADRPPHPGALEWALTLWTERLVGGPATRQDDPPVIALLTRLRGHDRYRLVHLIDLAKRSCAPKTPVTGDPRPLPPRDQIRIKRFRRLWGELDPRLARIAVWDLDETADVLDRAISPLGLITIGRLLAAVEPHRVRWALQHLPYRVVRWLRPRITLKNPFVRRRTLLDWETRIFQAAADGLPDEGDEGGDPS